jgi:hypothetical protein
MSTQNINGDIIFSWQEEIAQISSKADALKGSTMPPEPHLTHIAMAIQFSVAPVFLLTAIGTTLAVLPNRLSRIVDRARVLEGLLSSLILEG